MASNYKSLRCDCCAGTLEYSRAKKVWICQYCGNEMRREEEYDGLYTIKNVVKQTLAELAYGRLDTAQKNLAECEKIDSKYVGTMIARIAYQMYALITPGACAPGATKSLIGQLKRGYEEFAAVDAGISTEEEALYEFFEDQSEVLGVLVIVFDSLGDTLHRDFQEQMLDPSKIYSPVLNENLLRYAMKNQKMTLADDILNNIDNLNCKNALLLVLNDYPDEKEKCEHIARLMKKASLSFEDRKLFETYLEKSTDSYSSKFCVYQYAVEAKTAPSIEYIVRYLIPYIQQDEEKIRELILLICKTDPNDVELYYLVDRIFAEHKGQMALVEIKALRESGIFLAISARNICVMLNRLDLTVEEKIDFLDVIHYWRIDARTNDAVLSDYLNNNQDTPEIRVPVLQKLLSYVETISTVTLKQYIISTTTDGADKTAVLDMILKLNLNMSFFRELLQDYMKQGTDEPDVKDQIIHRLTDQGMQVDGSTLVQMACSATEENVQETAAFIQKMIQSGVRISNDALSAYLEKVPGQNYHSSMIHLLHISSSIITPSALNKYVLYGADDMTKAKNALIFAEQCSQPFGSTMCSITHLGNKIQCNLLQAYVLLAPDSSNTMDMLVESMKNEKVKLNPVMTVNGFPVKFKKYVSDNKASLHETTLGICEENKVFSLLF